MIHMNNREVPFYRKVDVQKMKKQLNVIINDIQLKKKTLQIQIF